ncbi:unnamed protein product [Somion occarium]|uniref:Uncharacterized protein n=2 Tax=Somion occarium TaxID=3059160 RepID=A0ABP1CHK6_9APHY
MDSVPTSMIPSATARSPDESKEPRITEPHHNTSVVASTVEPPPSFPANETPPINAQLKDPEVKDFGWNAPPSKITVPLMHGLSNDDIYALVRRFNKQIFNVRAIPPPPPGVLDLEISENEEFSPDKLRATLERLYMTVVVGLAAFAKHVARLRSWNEPRRTAVFCAAYYIAWLLGALLPVILLTVITLVVYPPSRKYLFPSAPLSLISGTTGNLQTPKAGSLGSPDSLSGAPEAHKGEAVEQEARHFVAGLSSVAVSTAAGKGPGEDGNGNAIGGGEAESEGKGESPTSIDGAVPDPVGMASEAAESKHLASGDNAKMDPAKKPVEDAIWIKARPGMRALEEIVDGWERFHNALSPTPPFSKTVRLRLAAPLVPLVLVTYLVPATVFLHMATFLFGFGLFGQPLITRGAYWLSNEVPHWREYLELRRTLLKGVPTNAQLTLTLLRIAERNKAPLPPPPTSADGPTPPASGEGDPSEVQFDTSNHDVDADSDHESEHTATSAEYDRLSSNGDSPTLASSGGGTGDKEKKEKKKPGRKIAGFVKGAVRASVEGALGADHVKASVGSEASKKRIGAVSDPPLPVSRDVDADEGAKELKESQESEVKPGPLEDGEGPSVFSARYHGKKGYIILIESATSPCVVFVSTKPSKSVLASLSSLSQSSKEIDPKDLHSELLIGLPDITEMRKVGGFGWKAKMVVGWALGKEVVDGLEVTDKEGSKWVLTAIRGRDELFNRLIAMGEHRWESY